ncbi:MAG TPA: hypothetical protein DCQ98_22690 [Planctomycetaceae bacterium]|nr:hypothetical protein [Planctomycetaceae bacterium]
MRIGNDPLRVRLRGRARGARDLAGFDRRSLSFCLTGAASQASRRCRTRPLDGRMKREVGEAFAERRSVRRKKEPARSRASDGLAKFAGVSVGQSSGRTTEMLRQ